MWVKRPGDVIITRRNQLTGNLKDIIVSGPATIENNTIKDNPERGIRVISPANKVQLAWNKVSQKRSGISVLTGN